jgi:hypothetical protein
MHPVLSALRRSALPVSPTAKSMRADMVIDLTALHIFHRLSYLSLSC